MPADAALALVSSRPTIAVDGQDAATLANGLLDLRIEEDVDGLYRCELDVGNWGPSGGTVGFLYFDRQTLDFGKRLEVKIGSDKLFDGKITGLEARFPEGRPPTLTVLAEDKLQDLRMTRRTRTFADSSDADVCTSIASDHALTPDVSVTGPTHKVLAQLNQSDLAFLRERARAVGAEVWVADTALSVKPRPSRSGGRLTLSYGRDLHEFTVLADLADQRSSVAVTGWDVSGKSALNERADGSTVSSEVGDGDSGSRILGSALAERNEVVSFSVPVTSDEARAQAEALFRARARRFVRGRGVADTSAALRVGATVTLEGLGPLFSGEFYVSHVTHRFDAVHGLRTEFRAERPGLGRAA